MQAKRLQCGPEAPDRWAIHTKDINRSAGDGCLSDDLCPIVTPLKVTKPLLTPGIVEGNKLACLRVNAKLMTTLVAVASRTS